MSLIYKLILSSYNFQATFLLLCGQAGAGLVFSLLAMRFFPLPLLQLPSKVEMTNLVAALPIGGLYVLNLAVSWWGLSLVNVPMFLCIRRTTTILTMIVEYYIMGTVPSSGSRVAVLIMMVGTLVAGSESFTSDYMGYLFILANNLVTAIHGNLAKRFSSIYGVKGFGLVLYNSIIAVPISLICALVAGEFQVAAQYDKLTDPGFLAAVVIASSAGAFMTYVTLLCTTYNSPTATSVTGNIKDIVSTFIGAVLFAGFKATTATVSGLGISFVGAGLYSYVKLTEGSGGAPASVKASSGRHAQLQDDEDGDEDDDENSKP
jgi:hypothetical protein